MIMKVGFKLKKTAKAKLTLKWSIEQLKIDERAGYVKVTNKELVRNIDTIVTVNNRWKSYKCND